MLAQRIRAIRDSRVAEHQAAIDAADRGRLFTALVVTSGSVGNLLAREWGGSYDVERTHAYLRILTDRQLGLLKPFGKAAGDRGPITDGLGSATGAAAFGVQEFTSQDPRSWELTWHHNTGGNPRPEHADADGTTVPAEIGFNVDPGFGAPGCACTVEPVNPKGVVSQTTTIDAINEIAHSLAPRMTAEEVSVFKAYQLHSYELNTSLRTGVALDDRLALRTQLLDSAISKGTFETDTTMFRGMASSFKAEVGDIIEDNGFVSTTPVDFIARAYSNAGTTVGKLLEIRIPEGTHAAFLGSEYASGGSVGEVILQRGLRYRVLSVTDESAVLEVLK